MVSLVIHGIIMLIGSTVYITQTVRFKDAVSVEFLLPKKAPLPQVRKPLIKFVMKPTVPISRTVVAEQVRVQPRSTTHAIVRPTSAGHPTVLEFSNKVAKLDSPHWGDYSPSGSSKWCSSCIFRSAGIVTG